MKNQHQNSARPVSPAAGTARSKFIRVLLVDDSLHYLDAAEKLLTGFSKLCVVGRVRSGGGAVRRIRELQPDLVLLDLIMPGMDGIEATRRIKAQPGAPRVIVVTLHTDPAYRLAARSAGADGFIAKAELFEALPVALHRLFDRNSKPTVRGT